MILPLTQERLDMMANVSRKLANRTLRRFCDEGWIEIGYGFVAVLRPLKLLAWAQASPRTGAAPAVSPPIVPPVTVAAGQVCEAGLGAWVP